MSGKEKDDDILYLDVDEYLRGQNINVNMTNNDKEKDENNEKR